MNPQPHPRGVAPHSRHAAWRRVLAGFPELPVLLAGITLTAVLLVLVQRHGTSARRGDGRGVRRGEIVVTRATIERMRRARTAQLGIRGAAAESHPQGERALVEAAIDDEILYREGLAQLESGADSAARERVRRLAAELEAGRIGELHGDGDEAAAATRADPVIRRHLVESARLALARQTDEPLPTTAEIDAWLSSRPDRFAMPARIRFEQVYLSRARRGAAAAGDAAALLARLRAGDATAASGGDPVASGATFDGSLDEIRRAFGPAVADALPGIEPGDWAGPLASPLGLHLVRVEAAVAARPPASASVRSRALHEILRERAEARLARRLASLRTTWDIRVEGPAHAYGTPARPDDPGG